MAGEVILPCFAQIKVSIIEDPLQEAPLRENHLLQSASQDVHCLNEIKIARPKASVPTLISTNIKSINTTYQTNRICCVCCIFFRVQLVKHSMPNMQFIGRHSKLIRNIIIFFYGKLKFLTNVLMSCTKTYFFMFCTHFVPLCTSFIFLKI